MTIGNDSDVVSPNPYAPPAVSLGATELEASPGHSETVEAQLANPARRFANFVIDGFAVRTLRGFAVTAVNQILGGWVHSLGWSRSTLQLVNLILNVGFHFAYYCLLEGLTGRTIGKWITGTRVVGLRGVRVTFGRIIVRSFARHIPFECVSFLFSEVGWHDRLSQTRVVRIPRKVSAPFSVVRGDQPALPP